MNKLVAVLCLVTMIVSTIVPMFAFTANAESATASINFVNGADLDSIDANTQVWSNGGVTITNNKGSSTTAVNNYSPAGTTHARFYKNSTATVTCELGNITQIVFKCTGASYSKIPTVTGGEATSVNNVITITMNSPSSTVNLTFSGSQVRATSMEVTYEAAAGVCTHKNTTFVNYANGTHNFTCDDCQEAVTVDEHNYVEEVCTICGAEQYPVYTIPQANAAPDNTTLKLENVEVVEIKTAYSSQYNNISLIVKDAEGNEFYCYRLKGNWNLGDVITVKGTKTTYEGIIEFNAGCTATLVSEGGFNVNAGAVQLLNGTTADSESTSARLVLTLTAADLAKLDSVGVYFSLTAGADANGVKKSTTTVFTSVNANGMAVEAADGTYYVLVEIKDIPQANFGTTIYVRPFVTVDDAEYLGAEVSFSVDGILNSEA